MFQKCNCLSEIDRLRQELAAARSAYTDLKEQYEITVLSFDRDITSCMKDRENLDEKREQLREALADKISEIAEYAQSFELYDDACRRGAAMWREAHPGNELTSPDTAKLVAWMLERISELEKELAEAKAGWQKARVAAIDLAHLPLSLDNAALREQLSTLESQVKTLKETLRRTQDAVCEKQCYGTAQHVKVCREATALLSTPKDNV